MGLRILCTASVCLALTLTALPATALADVDRDALETPSCASVYKGRSTSGTPSAGVAVPDDPTNGLYVRAEVVAPDMEGVNGTRLSVYASPMLCL